MTFMLQCLLLDPDWEAKEYIVITQSVCTDNLLNNHILNNIFFIRYHGLYIWFPEHLKLLEQESYFAETNVTFNLTLTGATYTGRLDNVKFLNVTMRNVTFKDIELRHVTFQSCHMTVCYFLNVSSAQTMFLDSFLDQSFFNNTNFYPEDFIRTEMVDTDINNTWSGCHVDIDVTISNRKLFLESFLTQLALIPTTLFSVYLIDKIGRRRLLGKSMIKHSVYFIFNYRKKFVCKQRICKEAK